MMIRLAIFIGVFFLGTVYAAEPLRGPEASFMWWRENLKIAAAEASHTETDNYKAVSQRTLSVDIPVPIALWVAMPFFTIRYADRNSSTGFVSDQRYGIGMLHHAAEGDPAWRLDFSRIGTLRGKAATRSRLILNLVKPFPRLRLRPSDTTFSWIAINALSMPGKKPLWIPEIAWSRKGSDGLIVDLLAPEHLYLGYRGDTAGVIAGVAQTLRNWRRSETPSAGDWEFERIAKLTLTFANNSDQVGEILVGLGALKNLDTTKTPSKNASTGIVNSTLGTELTLSWIPNP